ncbi:MAG TPA: division/cell wall cluster transcriptional repressor MraZ [Pseudolysinimonas sp.]|nr:division/cell wall cluster transcriptional repressor MraZ [Pseudolysinimonas sp.]
MLLGAHALKLDEKSRIIVPAKYRDTFAGGLVMTLGNDNCVAVYSESEFEKLHARMEEQAPMLDEKGRAYYRMFLGSASQEIPDKQSRVTIPAVLREHAGLERDLVFAGAGSRAEIWNADTWAAYSAEAAAGFAKADVGVIRGLF